MEKEKEIFSKISEIKGILLEKIKTFEDYELNKTTLISLIGQIEATLNQLSNNKEIELPNKEEQKENINAEIKNDIEENNNNNEKSKEKEKANEEKINEENNEENNDQENNEEENNYQEEEESEKNSLPKLNFDYDKNINEILGNISIEQNRPFLKSSSENDINDIIKENTNENEKINTKEKEMPKEENKRISNMQNNGYTNLFSFNQELSNINNKSSFTTEDFTTKKNNKIIKEKENLNNNIINDNINNSNQSEENKNKNNIPKETNEENENIKNSKALRVADIIMKINSNDILYDIITQIYSKEILDQLMSPDVDINLINVIEQTIDKITILENEEIQKLRNKEASISEDINNKNENEYNEIKEKDKYLYNELNKRNNNINNYNKPNIPRKLNEYKKYKSSSSFYDKNKNSSINSVSSINYANYPPKKISSYKKNKSKEMHLNSEILQNYPKTGKTILGYEKFKRDKNREFNFERSLRNDNYDDNNYNNINRRNYNLNISKADSVKSHSYYSINANRSYSNKKIFNNYTSPFGDYFDSSLQKGGESKLYCPKKNNRGNFKNARSPVKDYIYGLNDVYI